LLWFSPDPRHRELAQRAANGLLEMLKKADDILDFTASKIDLAIE
jgi:hypothetical protein